MRDSREPLQTHDTHLLCHPGLDPEPKEKQYKAGELRRHELN